MGGHVRRRAGRGIAADVGLRGRPVARRQPGGRRGADRADGGSPGPKSLPSDGVTSPAPLVEVEGLTFRYRRATGARDPRPVADRRRRGDPPRGRPVGLRQEHADPGDQRADPARLSGRALRPVTVDGQRRPSSRSGDIAATVGTVLQDPARQIVGATVESRARLRARRTWAWPARRSASGFGEVARRVRIEHLLGRETADALRRRAAAARDGRDPHASAAAVRRRRAARQPRPGDGGAAPRDPPRARRRGRGGRDRRAPRRGGARAATGSGPVPRGGRDALPRRRRGVPRASPIPSRVKLPFESSSRRPGAS